MGDTRKTTYMSIGTRWRCQQICLLPYSSHLALILLSIAISCAVAFVIYRKGKHETTLPHQSIHQESGGSRSRNQTTKGPMQSNYACRASPPLFPIFSRLDCGFYLSLCTAIFKSFLHHPSSSSPLPHLVTSWCLLLTPNLLTSKKRKKEKKTGLSQAPSSFDLLFHM